MKDLYKLAVAFEKASQNQGFPPIDPYIQASLNNLGYLPAIKVDGLLGPETTKALNWFKQTRKLNPNTAPDLVAKHIKEEAAKQPSKEERVNLLKELEKNKGLTAVPDSEQNPNFVDFTS